MVLLLPHRLHGISLLLLLLAAVVVVMVVVHVMICNQIRVTLFDGVRPKESSRGQRM